MKALRSICCLALLISGHIWAQKADSIVVSDHLNHVVKDFPNRNYQNLPSLDSCASYICHVFSKYGDSTVYQTYGDSSRYKNVISSFGPKEGKRIIIGAHYDVCGNQDGADDNASGVVGLLELARLFNEKPPKVRVDLVAYTLEEPPFFRSDYMGSFIHAKYLKDNNIGIHGMICLEMIGYFSDERKSQTYPLGILKLFYGGKGVHWSC